tara:strand:- start:207 stop:350 length:144 start_codon:yes stop_codon:yes gene_type:complete
VPNFLPAKKGKTQFWPKIFHFIYGFVLLADGYSCLHIDIHKLIIDPV